jgi:hypothetical protein
MRIGRYEFGLIRPLGWYKLWQSSRSPCGCTLFEFGFWYFTILRYECAGEEDTRIVDSKSVEELKDLVLSKARARIITLPPASPGRVIKIKNKGPGPLIVQTSGYKKKKRRKKQRVRKGW